MRRIFKYKILGLTVLLLVLSSSCSRFLDINEDPNNPTSATSAQLLPAAQLRMSFAFSNQYNTIASTLVQHIVNTRFDQYALNAGGTGLSNAWRFDIFAGALEDLDIIITQSSEAGANHFVGVAKLLKAYIYSMMVDLFNDLPYDEALMGEDGILYPVYEDAEGIYVKLLALIDDGIADLTKGSTTFPGNDDLIYGGDLDKWRRMGKTLKLKLFNQVRLVGTFNSQAEINALIAEGDLIASLNDDFQLQYGTSLTPENRHPVYQADYVTGNENHQSTTFNALLNVLNDPRRAYYYFDQNGGFLGRIPGSAAPQGNDGQTRTKPGLYPYGGAFGCCVPVDNESGLGDGIFPAITSFMKDFIVAEAELTLNANVAVARIAFEAGMIGAFAKVDNFAAAGGVAVMDPVVVSDYITARLTEYDAANDDDERLDIIITQKYIANWGNGVEAYNDFRRTGFPSSIDVDNIPDPNGVFPLRFPLDLDEFQGPNPPEFFAQNVPVFWDVN